MTKLNAVNVGYDTLFVGHYGSGNYGDDIMLEKLIGEMRAVDQSFRVMFFGNNHGYFGLQSHELVIVDRGNKIQYLFRYLKALVSCKRVVWGGGTCFTDEEGDGFFIGMLLAKLLNKRIEYRSIGVGKISRWSRILKLKLLMRFSSAVTLRDKKSLDKIEHICKGRRNKLGLERDLGEAYLSQIASQYRKGSTNDLLIAWRDLLNYGYNDSYLYYLIDYVRDIISNHQFSQIIIMDVDNDIDTAMNDQLYDLLMNRLEIPISRVKNCSFEEKNKLIGNAKVVVTARLHVLIAALEFEKVIHVFSYSPKIDYVIQENINNVITISP